MAESQPQVLTNLIPVQGDISLPGLGLSSKDHQMLIDNVSVVFHTAARVRFDEDLRAAIDCNVKGPQKVVTLCSQLKGLKANSNNKKTILRFL